MAEAAPASTKERVIGTAAARFLQEIERAGGNPAEIASACLATARVLLENGEPLRSIDLIGVAAQAGLEERAGRRVDALDAIFRVDVATGLSKLEGNATRVDLAIESFGTHLDRLTNGLGVLDRAEKVAGRIEAAVRSFDQAVSRIPR